MIAAVVIASGYSRRMGRSKLTLELGGRTFLQRALLATAATDEIDRRLVVVRPEDAYLVGEAISTLPVPSLLSRDIETLLNPNAADGQSASVRLAAERLLEEPGCDAVIFEVVDQPFLDTEVFDTLVHAWIEKKGEILISTYDGERGNPVLFARRFFPDLTQLRGDVGGREVIRRYAESVAEVPMPNPDAGRDIDTWDEYVVARDRLANPE